MIDNVVSRKDEAIRMCRASFLNTALQDRMVTLIEERSERLVQSIA